VTARLLVAEDDVRIVSFLTRGLQAEGYTVEHTRDGRGALEAALSGKFDLLILDRMLPGMEGLEICRHLRGQGNQTRVLMLTAKDALQDKVNGLKGGADDYVTKPFALDELLARIEALLRRPEGEARESGVLRVGELHIDLASKAAFRNDRRLPLTAKEFALLAHLMENAGTVVSRPRLLSSVWGRNFDPGTKVVDVYIRYLRRKVDEGEARPLIETVRGFGYMISRTP
jgi:two-component system, OmpR family, response regulator